MTNSASSRRPIDAPWDAQRVATSTTQTEGFNITAEHVRDMAAPTDEVNATEIVDGDKPHVLLKLELSAPDALGPARGTVRLDASFASEPIEIDVAARVRDT